MVMTTLRTSHRTIQIGDAAVPLKLVRDPRARVMRLSMNAAARHVRLTLPRWVSEQDGLRFVEERQALLHRWWREAPAPQPLAIGATVSFRGTARRIVHDPALGRRVLVQEEALHVGGPAELVPARLLRWLKAQSRSLLTADAQAIIDRHGIGIKRIRIGDPRSRWGSCSSTGTLAFSWRLVMAPDGVRRYVVAHEAAHLRHMNHSDAFWREVSRLGGDHAASRDWFRRHGAALHSVG
jgi:predicted metal-dependent hydrolase